MHFPCPGPGVWDILTDKMQRVNLYCSQGIHTDARFKVLLKKKWQVVDSDNEKKN